MKTLFSVLMVSLFILADSIANVMPETEAYQCNDGTRFTLRIERDFTWIFLPEHTSLLKSVPTEEGKKFEDDNTSIWMENGEAMLIRRGERSTACLIDRKATPWEAAKLDGADFRAVGNEPGWELLIFSGGKRIILTTDYGISTFIFKNVTVYSDKRKQSTVYREKNRKHSLSLTLSVGPCTDTMSDETYETKVSILLDGKTKLQGCGRALH